MTFIERVAERFGQAVAAFRQAVGRALHRPAFIGAWGRQQNWSAGWSWGAADLERHKRAIQNSWVFSAIDMIAREASAARVQVVEVTGPDDEPVQIRNHPLERLLRRPNAFMGRAFLWQFTIWWLKLDGNAYWFIVCDDAGHPVEIWPLPSFAVRPHFSEDPRSEEYIDYYEYDVGGRFWHLPAAYVVHIKRSNPFNPWTGLSELVAAMLPTDSDLAMSRWNAAFFGKQNTMPAAIINLSSGIPEMPVNPQDRERLETDLREEYAAFERRTYITTANSVTATLLGWNAKEMDFLAGRQFTKEEILTIYGVPLGVVDPNATEANANVGKARFAETVWSVLVLIAEQLTVELLDRFYVEQRPSAAHIEIARRASAILGVLVQPPLTERASLEVQFEDIRPANRELELRERDAARGVLTVDEIRARYFGADPLPEGRGENLETEMGQTLGDLGVPSFDVASVPVPSQALQTAIEADLRKWRTKAQRALKTGQSADVEFQSSVIPDDVMGHVRLHLQGCSNIDEVNAAFAEVAAHLPFFLSG